MSGWASVHCLVGDTSIRMAIALLEIPVSGWLSLCWRYQCQDGCHFVGDTSVRIDVTLLEIPVSGWLSLCWRYQGQDGPVYLDLYILWVGCIDCLYLTCTHCIICFHESWQDDWYVDPWIKFSPWVPELREQCLCVLCAPSPLNSVKFSLNLTYATVISTFPDLLLKYSLEMFKNKCSLRVLPSVIKY